MRRRVSTAWTAPVRVEDMEPAAFGALLGFVYTDTVPELDRLGEEEAASMAQHLLAGADRYGLERLKLICEWKLSDGITVDHGSPYHR